jgi:hypothetical protein
MLRHSRFVLAAVIIAVSTIALVVTDQRLWHGSATTAFAQLTGWSSSFLGAPAAPQSFSSPDLDIVVHSRDRETLDQLEPMDAAHGSDCGAPPATHHLTGRYEDAVFQCKDHVMTAIKAGGYGVIYLTPDQMVDFSSGEAVVRFDVSTFRGSLRDWWDIWVTPFEDNLVSPFNMGTVDLQGPPKRGITAKMDQFNGQSTFYVSQFDQHVSTDLGSCWWCTYESVLTPSMSRRDTFELRISKTHVKFWMPQYGITWVDKTLDKPLDWSQGIIQLGHHSYNPQKDCDPNVCQPSTWHWDNIQISQPAPFTAIKANERVAKQAAPSLTFNAPAPAGSFLRVEAIGNNLEVSLDNGATWTPLHVQDQSMNDEGHFRSYWHAIPAGTTRVMLRGQNWWGGEWRTDYAAIWSQSASGGAVTGPTATTPQTPASTATATPTTTSTAAPTSTPTQAPTNTPTQAPTNTPTQAPTKTPTSAPTNTPTSVPTSAAATATATATRTPAPTFTSRVAVSPASPTAGQTVALAAAVTSPTNMRGLVDIEVYDPSGQKVFQQYLDNQQFTAGQARTYLWKWTVPPTAVKGTYSVKLGVFKTGWGVLYSWNDTAGTMTVR